MLEHDGFDIQEGVLEAACVAELVGYVEANVVPGQGRGGVRNLLELTRMQELVDSGAVRGLVVPVLGNECFAVRGILFDKTADANWNVPWHQDVTIAVAERLGVEGFGPWSVKSGVVHVQPPAEVLEGMLSVRLHLDDCPAQNGALRVLPGTHRLGKVSAVEAAAFGEQEVAVTCEVGAGGALLMRPLLVHASSASTWVGHRRVLHFDFAAAGLPGGLEWASQEAARDCA